MDFCDIEQERYRDIETYSTGMRQKTKVAQAIVADPPILIFDEPTSGLDPEAREAMLNRVKNLSIRHGKTVIISTHILRDVQQICEHVIIMAKGKIKVADRLENIHSPNSRDLCLAVEGDRQGFFCGLGSQRYQSDRDRQRTNPSFDSRRYTSPGSLANRKRNSGSNTIGSSCQELAGNQIPRSRWGGCSCRLMILDIENGTEKLARPIGVG